MLRFLLLTLLLTLPACSREMASAPDSAPLFAASLTDTQGRPATLQAHRGKALIVNFWARWCSPCREEMPELKRIRAAAQTQGLEVVGIGIEEDVAAVRQFAQAEGVDYPLLLAGELGTALMASLGNSRQGLPYTLAIDRDGHIVASKMGLMRRADLEAMAAKALGK